VIGIKKTCRAVGRTLHDAIEKDHHYG